MKNKKGLQTRESNLELKAEVRLHDFPGKILISQTSCHPIAHTTVHKAIVQPRKQITNKNITTRVHSWSSQSARSSTEEADFMMLSE